MSRRSNVPNLLLVAYIHIILELLLRTQVSVYAFINQHWLYRGVSEDDTGSEEAVDDGEEDLDCGELAIAYSKEVIVRTDSLPFRDFECAYRGGLFACSFCPSTDGVERHLAMPRVWACFSAPWLNLLYRREALRQRHICAVSLSQFSRKIIFLRGLRRSELMRRGSK